MMREICCALLLACQIWAVNSRELSFGSPIGASEYDGANENVGANEDVGARTADGVRAPLDAEEILALEFSEEDLNENEGKTIDEIIFAAGTMVSCPIKRSHKKVHTE